MQTTKKKTLLLILLIVIVALSIISRIQISGWILALGWWILILVPIFYLMVYSIYLLKIIEIKKNHINLIYLSHLSYLLLLIFEYDLGDGPIHVVLFDFINIYSSSSANWFYKVASGHLRDISLILFVNFIVTEIYFTWRTRKYILKERNTTPNMT